jgi:hypothetical protein
MTPEETLTVATPVLPLLHVPPVVLLLSVEVVATQIFTAPVIADGFELTVTILVVKQPAPVV